MPEDTSLNSEDPSSRVRVLEMQTKLHHWATADPGRRLLLGADAEFSWGKADSAGTVGRGGALGAGRAGSALALGEPGHDQRGRGG